MKPSDSIRVFKCISHGEVRVEGQTHTADGPQVASASVHSAVWLISLPYVCPYKGLTVHVNTFCYEVDKFLKDHYTMDYDYYSCVMTNT